jgi:hypothetical protein
MKFGPPLSSVYRYQATDDAGRSWLLASKPIENISGKDDYNFWMIFCDGLLVWAKPGTGTCQRL